MESDLAENVAPCSAVGTSQISSSLSIPYPYNVKNVCIFKGKEMLFFSSAPCELTGLSGNSTGGKNSEDTPLCLTKLDKDSKF